MKTNDTLISESLLSFALRVYAKPNVQPLCLYLQDECNCDVVVVLWCLWLEQENRFATEEQLSTAILMVEELSEPLVKVLRNARRQLPDMRVFSENERGSVKQAILSAEIACEKAILKTLFDWTIKNFTAQVIEKNAAGELNAESKSTAALNRYVLQVDNSDTSSDSEGGAQRKVKTLEHLRTISQRE